MELSNLKVCKDYKILITGVAGFIGSNLLEFFLSKGLYVRGVDNFSIGFKKNIDEAVYGASKANKDIRFDFIEGDIRNYNICLKATKGIDIVLHEAALGSVQRSLNKPLESNSVNVDGTLNLLKASLENKINRFIYASSSSVYGDSDSLPKTEEMPLNPKSIYALTKLTAEYYCRLFFKLYGLETISLRYFNVFGKRQNPNSIYSAVIPRFLKNIMQDKLPVIYGDGNQSRDFTYIDNIIYANYLTTISDNPAIFGNFYNVACGNNVSLNEIIKIIGRLLNKRIISEYEKPRIGDIKHSLASVDKLKEDTDYSKIIDFKTGLKILLNSFMKKS